MEDEDDTTYNSESDETITLSEIVTGREVTLREEEIWALCRECCLTLEFVHSTQELFQSLVITPETVAFDRDGNVCFLDLDADPEPLYIPPEYEEDGCSYKSHLFSLGMTLLFAVEYSSNPDDEDSKSSLSQDIRDLLTHLTQDDPENRPDLELVLEYCDRALQDSSSQDVCQRFACVPTEDDIPKEEGASLLSMTEELAAYLNKQNGLVTPAQRTSANNSDTDSSKQVCSSRNSSSRQQQLLGVETQTAQSAQAAKNANPESSTREKKDPVTANPTSPTMDLSQGSAGDDSSLASPRKNRRRQGLLLSDILPALERDLQEAELWALCRECVISLQRKRKHLPAYISPDTVMVREVGGVSFKAIPEDKPLEVIYMAPELQQKGILNEKTCMYGLGVTLRCAVGTKYSDAEIEDKVGPAFLELLTTLLEANPDHRPSLEVCLMACDEFEKQGSTDSRLLCQEIYMDACALNSSREPKKSDLSSVDLEDSALMATELQTSWTELEETEREGVFLEDPAPEEEAATQAAPKSQGFQPVAVKQQATSSGSAFKPVPFKPKPGKVKESEDKPSQPAFPSAFSSPANYFKPIVLESAATSSKTTGSHSTGPTVTEDDEKEKNVMQKLREIKKNLLKHRPPGNLAKDVEVDDTKPPMAGEKTRTPRSTTSGRSSSRKNSGAGEMAGTLENFLQQLQSSGQMPDTDSLALAIAQHLQTKLGTGGGEAAGEITKVTLGSLQSTPALDKATTETSAVASEASGVESQAPVHKSSPSVVKSVSSGPQPVSVVSQMSQPPVPSSVSLPQFGSQISGLGMTGGVSQAGYMPIPMMPFSSGLMPGPVQYHLQQDPRTGLLQLLPVPVMPYGSSHSPQTAGSDQGHNPWQQPVAAGAGSGILPDQSADNEETLQRHAARFGVSSRNARGLIQKTASQRAKNAASASVSPTGYLSDGGAGLLSPHLEDGVFHNATSLPNKNGSTHRRTKSSGALEYSESAPVRRGDAGDSIDEYPLTLPDGRAHPSNRNVCGGDKSPQVHRSSSQSSSPSPSKDSGICLTQGVGAPPVSSASLMERLLSSESLRHQHMVTQVLYLLHQGFGDQGPDSFHSEEMLAEYIVSLAHVKWETFMHAVTEKYPQLFWSHGLLVNLFNAINKQSSSQSRTSAQTQLSGVDHAQFSKEKGPSPQSYDSHTVSHNRKQVKPDSHSAEGGEHSQMSTEIRQRPENDWNKQRHRSERGPSSTKGTEAEETHSVVRVLANGRYVSGPSETSDSTDNEQEEKRRRFKKRYELDRNKSSSLHNMPGTAKFSTPPEQGGNQSELPESRVHKLADGFPDQGVNSSQLKEFPVHRVQGHTDMHPDQCAYDMRIAKSYANRGDVEANRLDGNIHLDSNAAKSFSPDSYHSLPRPPRTSQTPLSQSQSRDGLSPSRSSVSSLPAGHRGTNPHVTSSEMPPPPSLHSRSQFGAMSQSQSSQQHSHHTSGITDSHVSQRPESRDAHRLYRDSIHHQEQDRTSLNNSSGSSSYSPAVGQNLRDGAGSRYPEHGRPQLSTQADLESQGFVYGQLREPLGKPPSNASPHITRGLRNAHSPNSLRELSDNRNSVPVFNSHRPSEVNRNSVPPAFSSRAQSEVNNNNSPKQRVGDRGSKLSSPRNRERSPVRKTQHTAKPRLAWDQEIAEYRKKGQVVYHSAMIQLSMTHEMDRFIHSVDETSKSSVENSLASLEQEISMLRRQRRKSQAFYKKLTDPGVKQPKGDQKGVVSQVLKDMTEMTCKLRYLDLCRTHLQMLLAELHGIDTCFLHSLVTSGAGGGRREEEDAQPLVLQRCVEMRWLQFQTVREAGSGVEVQVLQAGHPEGLMAYLFTLSALSDGYIHQFLFCFRYFLRAEDVFSFITQKYVSAHRGNQNDPDIMRTQQRAVDLLQFWVEGYYSVDFERNDVLLDHLEAFVMQRVGEGIEGSQNLMNLLYACHLGENSELIRQADDSEDQDEVYYLHLASPKRWESFRSLIGRRKWESSSKASKKEEKGVVVEKRPPSRAEDGSTLTLSRRTDITQLMDYAPHRLAEQLTLMEQDLFQRTHPVHYLDSQSQGVGVDLSIPSLRTPSMARKAKPGTVHSLFVGATLFEPRISELISHSQEITHWVSAEILCCGSQKSQVAALTKFLQTAQLCAEIRNYATALAIISGLDNLLVRQLPAWKHLPAKIANLMEDLEAVQVKLKGEPMALMQGKESHIYPTIPCVLYFLLHLQQLEIGGFTLANGMYKWQKMRSISQMIDQIRIFREHEYGFEPDYELQSLICRRLHELSDRDLHSVAAAHDNNFRRVVSHAAGFQGTWRKVKVKLKSRTK